MCTGWMVKSGNGRSAEARGCLVHHVHRLRLVVAHVDVGLVDAQRAARDSLAELSGEGAKGKVVSW